MSFPSINSRFEPASEIISKYLHFVPVHAVFATLWLEAVAVVDGLSTVSAVSPDVY